MVINHGQTSGHSFENQLTTSSEGEFIGLDLGDNFPRGIHLHKFNKSCIESRVVYTFKTEHGKEPQSPAGVQYPQYHEISKQGYAVEFPIALLSWLHWLQAQPSTSGRMTTAITQSLAASLRCLKGLWWCLLERRVLLTIHAALDWHSILGDIEVADYSA